MEEILESLTGFTESFSLADLSPQAIYQAKRRLVDGIGCLIGGLSSPPAVIARKRSSQVSGSPAASVAGLETKSSLEMAAFANTTMLRYWDMNDSGYRGGHHSETLPAALAAVEAVGGDGMMAILASAIAYEVQEALQSAGPTQRRKRREGWDYATFVTVTAALTTGKVLGLTREQLGHAAAIAAISNISTWASRQGKLSHWLACGSASANKNGAFSALLARDGMTGPEQPFVGKDGIMQMVTREPFSLVLDLPQGKELSIEKSSFKFFPIQDDAQGPVDMMLRLRNQVSIEDIEEIRVDSFHMAYAENGERVHPNKWDPQTREMADHSLPYTLAVALVDGAITLDSFTEERVKDPALRPIMELVSLYMVKEFEERLPHEKKATLTIRLRTGETVSEQTLYPFGHPRNPPTDEQLNEKFDTLASWSTDEKDLVHEIRDLVWRMDELKDLNELFGNLRRLHSNKD